MTIREFQVRKTDLPATRVVERDLPTPADNDLVLKVQQFALTTNNITYAAIGDKLGYWEFFPAADGWGIIPVWGIGEVIDSRHPEIAVGERFYGYFPMASHLVVNAGRVNERRMVDMARHRSHLPPLYNNYARLSSESDYSADLDVERVVLLPLYATSFCIYDRLVDNNWFDAAQVVVLSASSKTALGIAYALHDDPAAPTSIGVTSARNLAAVETLGLYDQVLTYEAVERLDASKPTVVIDISGDRALLKRLCAHLGDNMQRWWIAGFTHKDAGPGVPDGNAARIEFFFAPDHIKKRAGEWGPGEFERRSLRFWRDAAERSRTWLTIDQVRSAEALDGVYADVLTSKVAPDRSFAASL